MAYTKVNFDEQTPLSQANLNQMENMYDEVLTEAISIRANGIIELRVQVVTSNPSHQQGLMIYNSTLGQFLYSDGVEWKTMALQGEVGLS